MYIPGEIDHSGPRLKNDPRRPCIFDPPLGMPRKHPGARLPSVPSQPRSIDAQALRCRGVAALASLPLTGAGRPPGHSGPGPYPPGPVPFSTVKRPASLAKPEAARAQQGRGDRCEVVEVPPPISLGVGSRQPRALGAKFPAPRRDMAAPSVQCAATPSAGPMLSRHARKHNGKGSGELRGPTPCGVVAARGFDRPAWKLLCFDALGLAGPGAFSLWASADSERHVDLLERSAYVARARWPRCGLVPPIRCCQKLRTAAGGPRLRGRLS